jgi:hypothetical protein
MNGRGPKLVLGDHQNSSRWSSDMMASFPKLTRVLLRPFIKARASHVETQLRIALLISLTNPLKRIRLRRTPYIFYPYTRKT